MWFIIIATTVLLIVIHWIYNEFFGYWKRRGVPHPYALPFVGNLGPALIVWKSLGSLYADIYNNCKYKDYLYVGLYKAQQPTLIIRDIGLIKTIMIKEFLRFQDNDIIMDDKTDPTYARNPFLLKGQRWKIVRAQIASAVTVGKIKNMFNLMLKVSKNLIELINQEMKIGDAIDAKELAGKFTSDVVAISAFGLEANSLTNSKSEFRLMGRRLFELSFWGSIKNTILFALPPLSNFLKISLIPKDVQVWFVDILQKTIKYRETNNIVRNDYLDTMISLKSKPGEYEFTDTDVIAQAMTFFVDGSETSSIALSFTLYALAKNPKVQRKLQEEIDETLKKCTGEVTYEELQNMNYLDMVVSETMRIYTPILFLNKVCTKQFTLPPVKGEGTGPNVILETGTSIIIPIYAIHMNPTYYPEPEEFIPERFSEEGKQSRPKCTYLPFGEGPRMCLGFRFALLQIRVALISIFSNFNIKLNPKTTPTFEMDQRDSLMSKKGGIWVNFEKRTY